MGKIQQERDHPDKTMGIPFFPEYLHYKNNTFKMASLIQNATRFKGRGLLFH